MTEISISKKFIDFSLNFYVSINIHKYANELIVGAYYMLGHVKLYCLLT